MSAIAQTFEHILGADAVCSWETLNAIQPSLQSQIAQAITPETQIDCIIYPSTLAELAEAIACAHTQRWRVLLCGSGSKLHWGGLAQGIQVVISTARMNRLIEHAAGDMTVTVEAGMRFVELQALLAKSGQFLTADPAYPQIATVGGIVATADTGALRQRYGGIREFLIGISIARTDGQTAKAGGRVVKNVAGYDLMKLFTGSYGTLGAIGELTFRLYPLPAASRTVVLTGDAEAIAQATSTLRASGLTPTAIELLSAEAVKALFGSRGADLGLIARFQGIEISVEKQTEQVLKISQTLGLSSVDLTDDPENSLWHQRQELMEHRPPEPQIFCKIGVLPARVVETLVKLAGLPDLAPAIATFHASSGLGTVRCSASLQSILDLRQICQAQSGFLTVLEAPIAIKQKLDVWGYSGNSLEIMRRLKQQFDSENLFSPGRFVGGI
ncbi:MAG: FAD-binding oxidoreductase [Drouetiella hepatica Uher 2000/2452]|jgi:glycolate oxidase FAD binding subunit|uniref:FAD-binding oxidoreductase n=1 Tax=Drouetiella hepatica Uher 2000/2452 TaxID=904376 RepID=A0A951Q754_9CYAN|nr:FAD-binding oxidoreductase [Drouetiella hepatica Uher 2000/2452]